MEKKIYLGDGVYAELRDFMGDYQIVLTTENGIETTNTIYLDSSVTEQLLKYIQKVREGKIQ